MTSRSQRKTPVKTESNTTAHKRIENSWILVVKESLLKNSNFSIVTIPHPARKTPSKYCLDAVNNKLYEVVTFNEPYRSWFIGATVKSDGSLQLLTPVNPLFLVLPRLKEQCSSRAVPLEDLLSEKGFDKLYDYITNMELVADLKGPADMKAYKYNEEKTLTWLEDRVRKVARVLREKNIHVASGVMSATFVASNIKNETIDDEFYLKYAHGLISEYLQDDLVELLEKRFDFKPELIESLAKKRKSEVLETHGNGINKRVKTEQDLENLLNSSSQSFTETKKQKPLTAKEKARQKAASGTKTISSFFVKK